MKRIAIVLAVLVVVLSSTGFAEQNANWIWYDGFSSQWLNSDKWYAGPICTGMAYDCVRNATAPVLDSTRLFARPGSGDGLIALRASLSLSGCTRVLLDSALIILQCGGFHKLSTTDLL
jgi:hypothetical protein